MSLIALALVGIAWGAMPVNSENFRMGRIGDALVALAGPAMNFVLAIGTALLTPLAYHFSEEMGSLLELGVGLNILLGLFNLLPIPPFDGGRILVSLVREVRQLFESPGGQNISLIAFMLLFLSGAFGYLQSFSFGVAWLVVDVFGVLWSPILG